MENYERALEADKEQDRLRALTLNNMGNLARTWGAYKKALDYFNKTLEMARSGGNSREEAETLLNISRVNFEWGRYEPALENAQQALQVFTKIGASTDWAKKTIADIYLELGQPNQAEPYAKEAEYDSSLGRLYLIRQEPEQAKKHYELLMAAGQKEGNLEELFTAYTGLGKAYEALKNYKQSETYYTKAIDVAEEIRSSLLLSERKNFFAVNVNGFLRSEPAKGLIRVTLKQNKALQSVFPSEASRAREFADILSQRVEGVAFGVPQEILGREANISNRFASLKTSLPVVPQTADQERYKDISKEIKKLETEKNAFVQSLWRDYKDYASVRYPKPVKLEEAAVGPDEHVIVFDLLGDVLGVKVLKGKKIVDAFIVEWSNKDLEEAVGSFRRNFEKVQLAAFDADLASKLYGKLLERALQRIPPGNAVTIIPDGVLALLPFEALVTKGQVEWKKGLKGDEPVGLTYVSDLYPLVYYQSLTAMNLMRNLAKKKKPGDRILVVADPVFEMKDLRAQATRQDTRVAAGETNRGLSLMAAIEEEGGSGRELKRLSRTSDLARGLESLYGSSCDAYTGLEASKDTFLKMAPTMDRYRSIVFATHGFASSQIAGLLEPALALTMVPHGTDGYLTISEVAGLKLNADIAALTACQTGTGDRLAGEGVMSMGRAFQCAGARSVLMSLWSVAEDSSILLVDEFFKQLKTGRNKLDAWTQARSQVRKAGFEHPFFWGAFILVGEAN